MKDERLKVEKQLSLVKVMDRLERSVSIENIVNGFYVNGRAFPEDDGEMLAVIGLSIQGVSYTVLLSEKYVSYLRIGIDLFFTQLITADYYLTRKEQQEIFSQMFQIRLCSVPVITRDLVLIPVVSHKDYSIWVNPKVIDHLSQKGIQLSNSKCQLDTQFNRKNLIKYGYFAYLGQAILKRDLDSDRVYQKCHSYETFLEIPKTYYNLKVIEKLKEQTFHLQRGNFLREWVKYLPF